MEPIADVSATADPERPANNIDDVKHVVTNDHGDRYDFIYSKNSDDSYYLNIGKERFQ